MYEDVLKEKENLGIKLVQGEEEKRKMARENELLGKKVSENGRVCILYDQCTFLHFLELSSSRDDIVWPPFTSPLV